MFAKLLGAGMFLRNDPPVPPAIRYVRYGTELEGANAGMPALILLTARHHRHDLIRRVLEERGRMSTTRAVWLQCQQGERYNWRHVLQILMNTSLWVTAQVRDERDLPSFGHYRLSLVWRIPDEYAPVAAACTHATWFGKRGPFDGHETRLHFRDFAAADYEQDEVWVIEEE